MLGGVDGEKVAFLSLKFSLSKVSPKSSSRPLVAFYHPRQAWGGGALSSSPKPHYTYSNPKRHQSPIEEAIQKNFMQQITSRGQEVDGGMAVIDVDGRSWEEKVISSTTPVIVDFWATWCPWCKRLAPDFESLSGEYSGRLSFTKVNVEEAPEIASKYGVQGLPTLKFFCQGRPIADIMGYLPRSQLKMQLDQMLSMYKECLEHSSVMK